MLSEREKFTNIVSVGPFRPVTNFHARSQDSPSSSTSRDPVKLRLEEGETVAVAADEKVEWELVS